MHGSVLSSTGCAALQLKGNSTHRIDHRLTGGVPISTATTDQQELAALFIKIMHYPFIVYIGIATCLFEWLCLVMQLVQLDINKNVFIH